MNRQNSINIHSSIFNIHSPVFRETDCENRLNMLDTAQKVNSKVDRRLYKHEEGRILLKLAVWEFLNPER